ncbi:MAG: dihydroorotate dehydrogenase [bacterium]
MEEPSLNVEFAGLKLKNPIISASGTFGFGFEYKGIYPPELFGALILKGTTLLPREGNPPPRLYETASGLINSIGLQNPGIEVVYKDYIPQLQVVRENGTLIFINIAGETRSEYSELAKICDRRGLIDGIEVNLSCPNIKRGGVSFGVDPDTSHAIVKAVRENTTLPLIAKLAPVVSDIGEIAKRCELAGADAISAVNTLPALAIDIQNKKFFLGSGSGGLSGPAIKPFALMQVYKIAQSVSIPVIGCGGITTWQDAVEFILVGSTAIQVGTGLFINGKTVESIIEGLIKYLKSNCIDKISEIKGALIRDNNN